MFRAVLTYLHCALQDNSSENETYYHSNDSSTYSVEEDFKLEIKPFLPWWFADLRSTSGTIRATTLSKLNDNNFCCCCCCCYYPPKWKNFKTTGVTISPLYKTTCCKMIVVLYVVYWQPKFFPLEILSHPFYIRHCNPQSWVGHVSSLLVVTPNSIMSYIEKGPEIQSNLKFRIFYHI